MTAQLGQAGRTCASCRYFDAGRELCRFTAPSVVGWPSAVASDWCGEYTPPRTEAQAGEPREGAFPTLSAVDDVPRFARGRR